VIELQKAIDLCGRNVSFVLGCYGYVHAAAGDRAEASKILEEMQRKEVVDLPSMARLETGLGDTEAALRTLEKAVDARGMAGLLTKVDPAFDPLRSDPRFEHLLRRMNLA
jgi:hypothetical protein